MYYPYTHIRDEAWLKAAALYLPKLALIAPAGYPRRLSPTADVLRAELGFLVDVDPAGRTGAVATEFLQLLSRESDALQARYAWPPQFPAELHEVLAHDGHLGCWPEHPADHRVEWVHVGKIPPHLIDALVETRLAVPSDDRFWIALHPRLASVYLAALAERIAQANAMPVVTDQSFAYGALNGWQLDTLARVLLSEDSDRPPAARPPGQVAALYGALAVQAVVPEGLSGIPAERIVRARRALAAEFDAFCVHLDSMAGQFAELAAIEDVAILRARLEVLAGRDLRQPTAELETGLRKLGLEPARAVLGMKTLQLPAIAAAAATGAGLPIAAGQGGLVAAQFVASSIQAHQTAQQLRRSAAGYLLGLHQELSPRSAVDRVRRLFRRASSQAS
ncbi:MAG TPA: DUF6236 family protein [Streptosporangiaceae bacterium]|nr:DUF6236 family protein [Streptosporangiaceae bacterium]